MGERLDMTMMLAVHDALRRESAQVARLAAGTGRVAAAVGWELFATYLRVHHTTEDDILWPALRAAAGPGEQALLDAMEAEHAVLDPLIAAIDAGQDVADRADALVTAIDTHLRHEETDVLPLIQAVLPAEQWQRFGQEHGLRIGADAPRYLPWMLEGMPSERAGSVLDRMPPPIREQYRDQWRSAYAELVRWPA